MLWIYFDRQGVAKCKVNVGNKIRQGDSIELAVYLEGTNEGTNGGWGVLSASYLRPDQDDPSYADGISASTETEVFSLGNPSQANFYFENGKEYRVWKLTIPADATTFEGNGGMVGIRIVLSDDPSSTDESVAQRRTEVVSVYVEPTYGLKPSKMNDQDYARLLRLYQNCDAVIVRGEGVSAAQQEGDARASKEYSFAAGLGTVADSEGAAAVGRFNEKESASLFSVGNGTDADNRSTAFRVLRDGRAKLQGDPVENSDVATKRYVDTAIASGGKLSLLNITNGDADGSIQSRGLGTSATGYYSIALGPGVKNAVEKSVAVGRDFSAYSGDVFSVGADGSALLSVTASNTTAYGDLRTEGDLYAAGDAALKGDVTVDGDLAVEGTLTANVFKAITAETMSTKKHTIGLAEGNTESIAGYVGLYAVKYDGESDGALVWDNTGTAYVGDAVVAEDGSVSDPNGTLQPLLTRPDSSAMADGGVLVWSAEKLRAETSKFFQPEGEDGMKMTDGADSKAHFCATKGTASVHGETSVALSSDTEIKLSAGSISIGGKLTADKDGAYIDAPTSGKMLANKDYADTKLTMRTEATTSDQVYAKAASGGSDGQRMLNISSSNDKDTIALRTSSGQLKVNKAPEADDDATSKKYVDDGRSSLWAEFVKFGDQDTLSELQQVDTGLYSVFKSGVGMGAVRFGTLDGTEDVFDAGFEVQVTENDTSDPAGSIDLMAKEITLRTSNGSGAVNAIDITTDTATFRSPMGTSSIVMGNGSVAVNGDVVSVTGDGASLKKTTSIEHGTTSYEAADDSDLVNKKYLDATAVHLSGDETITGVKLFKALPKANAGLTPKTDTELTPMSYVDGKFLTLSNSLTAGLKSMQEKIDAINASQNFVATYATNGDLPSDGGGALEGDCVLVLKDASKGNQAYVYKWEEDMWKGVGPLGDYYTTSQIDDKYNSLSTDIASTDKTLGDRITALDGAAVHLEGEEKITGLKTFGTLPQSSVDPSDDKDLVTKKYVTSVDDAAVHLAGPETISGVKIFSALPRSNVTPSKETEFVTLGYMNTSITASATSIGKAVAKKQTSYDATNVRAYVDAGKAYDYSDDLSSLADGQLIFALTSDGSVEPFVVSTNSDGNKTATVSKTGRTGNGDYYVTKGADAMGKVQTVRTGLASTWTSTTYGDKGVITSFSEVSYGTDSSVDGGGFFVSCKTGSLSASSYSGSFSVGAKRIEMETCDPYNDTHGYVFEADQSTTTIRSPNSTAWREYATGQITDQATTITLKGALNLGKAVGTATTSIAVAANGNISMNGPVKFSNTDTASNFSILPQSSATPTDDKDLVTKKYVDGLDAKAVHLSGDETITGLKTFSTLPKATSSLTPTEGTYLTPKKYVDDQDTNLSTTLNSKISAVSNSVNNLDDSLSTVAKSGSYDDLSDKPSIPSAVGELTNDAGYITADDLPTVNNGTLTLQINGVNKTTFSANASSDVSFNVTASDLGLSQALKFVGKFDILPAAEKYSVGDVVLVGNKEYVLIQIDSRRVWDEMGDESSHALKTVSITGTGALSGGGTLGASRTITHNAGDAPSKESGLYKFSTDEYSHISSVSAVTKSDITDLGIPSSDTKGTTGGVLATAGAIYFTGSPSSTSMEYGETVKTAKVYVAANSGVLWAQSIAPTADLTYDLGTSDKRWKNAYINSLSASAITADSTITATVSAKAGVFYPTTQDTYSAASEFSLYGGNPTINTRTNKFTIGKIGTNSVDLVLDNLSSDYDYYFPEKGGTFAMTSDLSDFVTMSTEQTITAKKKFTAAVKADSINDSNNYGMVRYRTYNSGTQHIFGDSNATAVIMGSSARPFYSSSGTDFSGSELALKSDLPVVPSVYNGKLTIKVGGNSKGTFSANQSGDAEISITASDLGLSGAMRFLGRTTTEITDGSQASEITLYDGTKVTPSTGEVVTYGDKEYIVNTGGTWEELGDESSHALKTVSITGTGALSGGGTIESDRTITHNTTTREDKTGIDVTLGFGDSFTHLQNVFTDDYGHVTGIKANTVTLPSDTNLVHKSGEESISGVKTFSKLPMAASTSLTPTSSLNFVTQGYVATVANTRAKDSAVVHNTGDEDVGGLKTFSTLPQSSATPSADADLATKKYIDTKVEEINTKGYFYLDEEGYLCFDL